MGLCKCSKKKVTNQFCFEHKVNVCEYCMTTGGHQTCIVGPYLQWLENSSFDSNCFLCKTALTAAPCLRLCCYHIIHLECLNNYACQLPPNTAPAGYVCPICTIPIFSFNPGSTKSPVGSLLEKSLSNFPWAREGIGLHLMDSSAKVPPVSENSFANGSLSNGSNNQQTGASLLDDSTKINMSTAGNSSNFAPKLLHNNLPKSNNYAMSSPISVNNVTSFISTNSDLSFGSTSSMRSKFDSESRRSLLTNVKEIAEDKYRTKSPIEFVSRWLRSRSSYMRNQSTMSGMGVYKRLIIYGLIGFLFLFVLIHFFLKFGRQSAENDPFLDPKNDPNLRSQFE